MSLQENVENLVAMGIAPDIAESALKRCNNNIEQAAGLIYQDVPDTISDPLPSYDSRSIPLGSESESNTASIRLEDDIKSKIASYGYGNADSEYDLTQHHNVIEKEPVYNVYEDFKRMVRTEQIPPILLPNKSDLLEGYFAPLLMILSNIPEFRNLILHHQFFGYGYAPQWWKNEKCLQNPSVVLEIQRLVAFLTGDSNREFASIRNLTDVTSKMITEEYESSSEFIQFILTTVVDLFAKANYDLTSRIQKLLSSSFHNLETGETSLYRAFPVEKSDFAPTIYEILHNILWGKNFEMLGKTSFQKFGDVITVSFDSNGDNMMRPFKLDEKFYPQIYTEEYCYLVKAAHDNLLENRAKVKQLSTQLMFLRSFKGKKVPKVLEATLSYLESLTEPEEGVEEAFEEILAVSEHIQRRVQENNEKINTFTQEKSQINIYDIDYLFGELKAELEPWILTGIIVNERQFCYLRKYPDGSQQWVFFNYELDDGKDFKIDEIEYDDLAVMIQNYSLNDFETGMVLVYVRESVFNSTDYSPMHSGLAEFIHKDNETLAADIEAYSSAVPNELDNDDDSKVSLDDSSDDDEKENEDGIAIPQPENEEQDAIKGKEWPNLVDL
ncbi:hypothetical protein CANARDRAFT_194035 [[Candida] arabinofermentans NRRL YB-2248]|uniref:UBA domain-containing protein n=1 Tax=[Candida] arabinofermentans NRRL YB-2248 TaxID=983967 RepID=A0A1E4T643_9ASCO|nr:hypothetical protein CANARDRAFT_194035 [[Candida] arabinofermentans NRRL YB-2248]